MFRTCKMCGETREYDLEGKGLRAMGFAGYVCVDCYLGEQQKWRETELGRRLHNESSRESKARAKPNKMS